MCSQVDEAAISSSFRQRWRELQKLLERQRSKGGIIDPEVESNRFLIHINEVRGAHSGLMELTESFPFLVLMLVDSLRPLLKTGAQRLTGRPPPPQPRWTRLHWDCPTVEAVSHTGTTREEAGPGPSTGAAPPSHST